VNELSLSATESVISPTTALSVVMSDKHHIQESDLISPTEVLSAVMSSTHRHDQSVVDATASNVNQFDAYTPPRYRPAYELTNCDLERAGRQIPLNPSRN
jgi:hypothetical protein